jgi:hypothetical protein
VRHRIMPVAKVEADPVTRRLRLQAGNTHNQKGKSPFHCPHITFILRRFAAADKSISYYFACCGSKYL